MRVVVADDSAFMRRAIGDMLTSDPEIEVVGKAHNGREAIDMAKRLKPDVITLDIEMPEMDGLTALRHIMRTCPTQVLMVSSLTTEGSVASLQALRMGAADVLAKDQSQISLSITNIKEDLLRRVKGLGAANPHKGKPVAAGLAAADAAPVQQPPVFRDGQFDVICIGSSTGGPPVLETICAALPATLSAPVLIAQHMPEIFTRSMTARLDGMSPLTVVHAEQGMPISKGHIYVAPGGKHMHVKKDGLARYSVEINTNPAAAAFKPSVSVLFDSAAKATGKRTLGVVLTGIGDDGLTGARELHAAGATLLAQSAETCVVYGMPKAVTQAGLVSASLSPTGITRSLASLGSRAAA